MINKSTEAEIRASKKYRKRVQEDEKARRHRNKITTLRSARNHIRNYSDKETLEELQGMIDKRLMEIKED